MAFLVRIAAMTLAHTYRITPRNDHFDFGWEMGRIARSIALGQGYSNPLNIPTGPTVWAAPLYPYLLAGVFKVFGIYSNASGWVILAVNSVFGALTCWTLYRIAQRIFDRTAARWVAWTWALFPYAVYWSIRVVWETSLGAWLLSLTILQCLRIAEEGSWRRWSGFGLLWGVIGLTNPTLFAVMPFQFLWLLAKRKDGFAGFAVRAACACLLLVLVLAPWLIRNELVFGKFVFIRDNLGLELRVSNNELGEGLWTRSLHPANDKAEMARFQSMGELAYMADAKDQAMQFARSHPGTFAWYNFERWVWFWTGKPGNTQLGSWNLKPAQFLAMGLSALLAFMGMGMCLRRRIQGAYLLLIPLVFYPLPYALAHPAPRYRHAIEPVMALLIVFLFTQLRGRKAGWTLTGR
jgi:4-amino-4-deoxy-L-arabinose transferase-like glycosyltransferase